MRICLGIPVVKCVDGTVYHSHLDHVLSIAKLASEIVIPQTVDVFPHDRAREAIMTRALGHECDYLMFLDSDMIPEAGTFEALWNVMQDKKPAMVVAHCYRRGYPYSSTWIKEWQGQPINLSGDRSAPVGEIDTAGLACNLIDLSFVRKHLTKPFFYQGPQPDGTFIWEDAYFCRSIRQCGGIILAVPSARCGHLGGGIVIDDSSADRLRQQHMTGQTLN